MNKNTPIKIFHGVSRYGHKGSNYILAAMNKIKQKYKKDVECIVVEKLPYSEYIPLLQASDIVIDQTNSYGTGMNGLIAMAMGKVVLSGNEKLKAKNDPTINSPCINIQPSSQQIFDVLDNLIDNRQNIDKISEDGRSYVKSTHSHVNVAQQYVNRWKKSNS